MSFFGEIPCIRCHRNVKIPSDQATIVCGKTSETLIKVPCPYCKEDFFVEIKISANMPQKTLMD
jgi:DNA-directed RNA polymerase subunit RPC12/RpoP